jgi:hypothetical protein
MKKININFSQEFMDEFTGTYQELGELIKQLTTIVSVDDFEHTATSMMFNTTDFDKVLEFQL